MKLFEILDKLREKMQELFPQKSARHLYHSTTSEVLWEFLKPCCMVEDEIIVSPHGQSENLRVMANMYAALRKLDNRDRKLIVASESQYKGVL